MKVIKIFCLSLSFVALLLSGYAQENDPQRIDSTQLKQTNITAYMQESITAGKNLIYCSTFQIAWDELSDGIIKESLKLQGNPIIAQMLNKRLTGKTGISEDCYLAMAGFKKDGIEDKIKHALKEKFNTIPGIDISLQRPDDILAYAFLLKDLKFEQEFENLDEPIVFNKNVRVKSFGIEEIQDGYESREIWDKQEKLIGQVSILDYKSDSDFIIGLKSASPNDEIILAKVNPGNTLLGTIDSVFGRISKSQPSKLKVKETLRIPKLDFDIIKDYSELKKRYCINKGFEKYFIAKAIQAIRFKINEKGALLKSEAEILMTMGLSSEIPRRFIFDKPFLLCLKQKGVKYPYFAIWVDNAEILIKENSL